jgi:hypothetical protein
MSVASVYFSLEYQHIINWECIYPVPVLNPQPFIRDPIKPSPDPLFCITPALYIGRDTREKSGRIKRLGSGFTIIL